MTETSPFISEPESSKKIVIIGAGISGLACAKSLREFGFQNVLILEGRSRVGGRIKKITFGSDVVEMGAQWIHGQKNNVIYEIAESEALINTDAFNYITSVRSLKTLSTAERKALNRLFEFLDEKLNDIPKDYGSGISLLSYLDDQFKIFSSDVDNSGCKYLQDGYEWYCNLLLEINGCDCLSLLSLNLYNNYKECEGNPVVEVKNGVSCILDIFLSVIPNDSILKNKCVKKIDWSDFKVERNEDSKTFENNLIKSVKVFCEDGEIVLADHVVVTIPLGCLKKSHQSLFVPSLCESKQRAIECLGFGTINKIYFYFDEPFWDGPAVFPIFRHQLQTLEGWLQYINRFAYTPGCPNVLCAWVAGKGAVIMELLSDAEVMRDCLELLEKIVRKKLATPCRMYRSKWHSDPFACGSYSFLSIDCEREGLLPSTIAEPEYSNASCVKTEQTRDVIFIAFIVEESFINLVSERYSIYLRKETLNNCIWHNGHSRHPVLLFAGEATNNCHFSTIHGAYETGIREAERLFHYYR